MLFNSKHLCKFEAILKTGANDYSCHLFPVVGFQKLLEVEDAVEDERKDLTGKIESLESIVRMLELKAKNSSDHGSKTCYLQFYLSQFIFKACIQFFNIFNQFLTCKMLTKIYCTSYVN